MLPTIQEVLSQPVTPTQPLDNLNSLIEHYDLAELPVEPSNNFQEDKTLIPNIMHYIYVVNPINDWKQLNLIKQFKEKNPDYKTILWVDPGVYSEVELAKLLQWAKDNRIHLMDIEQVLAQHMGKIRPNYLLEIARKSPGAASDILRVILLKEFGGIYSDIDVLCTEKLGPIHDENGIQLNSGRRQVTGAGQHPLEGVNPYEQAGMNNDLLIARPHHPFLDEYINKIHQNYEKTAASLFPEKGTADFKYQEKYKDLGTKPFRKQWTMYTTGPCALRKLAEETSLAITREVSMADKFIFGCSLSWDKGYSKTKPLSHDEELDWLITSLLVDLHQEPRVLRLAAYYTVCSSDTIMDEAIEFIGKNYPEVFAQVEFVHDTPDYSWGVIPPKNK